MAEAELRKALIFRMTGEESAGNAAALAQTLRGAGYLPTTVPFWSDADHAAHDPVAPVLLDGGFDFAPRLSAFAFAEHYGASPDLIELSAHNLVIGDARIDNMLTESVWSQQLRGVAGRAVEVMRALSPQVVFVPHGAEVVSRLLAVVTTHLGIPYLYWESAFFPGYHFVDPDAPHFFKGASRIDRTWPPEGAAGVDPAIAERGARFIAQVRAERVTKYRQETDAAELAALKDWLALRPGPVLFVPGQIAFDATIAVSLRDYPDLATLYRAAFRSLPPHWRVIFKPHPRGPEAERSPDVPSHVRVVRHIAIHDLFPLADAVGLHSSNVGLEALMAGLPVIAWGDPYYGRKGLTLDIADGADLGRCLAGAGPARPDPRQVAALVGHVLENGLVRHGDAAALAVRIAEATAAPPPPRSPWYGASIRRLLAIGERLEARLKANRGMAAALRGLSVEDRLALEQRFGARALQRQCRRAGRLGLEGWARRLLLARLFRARLKAPIRFDAVDLETMHEPLAALAAVAERARRGGRLVLLRHRPASATVIQRFAPRQMVELFARVAPDLGVEVFGWSALGPTAEVPEDGPALLLLRPAGAPALSIEDRLALTRRSAPPEGRAGRLRSLAVLAGDAVRGR